MTDYEVFEHRLQRDVMAVTPVAALHQGAPGQMPWLKSFYPGLRLG